MFADAAGEDEEIQATEDRGVSADGFARGSCKHFNGQLCVRIVHGFVQLAHIGRKARNAEEAGLLVEELFEFVGAEVGSAKEMQEHAGVEVAGAGAHDDAAGGSETHGGIHGTTVGEGGDAGSVAEMRDERTRRKLIAESMDNGFAGNSVKAIAADAGRPEVFRKRKARSDFRQRAMESGVETGELRNLRELKLCFVDEGERDGNVQGREGCSGFQLLQDLRGEALMFPQRRAAVDDAVADGGERRKI